MKILWIDDFNRATTNSKRIDFVSESLGIYVDNIEKRLNRLAISANHEPELLQDVLKKNPNPIYWYDGFVNGLQAIIEESPFDFIILSTEAQIFRYFVERIRTVLILAFKLKVGNKKTLPTLHLFNSEDKKNLIKTGREKILLPTCTLVFCLVVSK